MFFKYLIIQRTVLIALLAFFANRAWNYYDKLYEITGATNNKYWMHFSFTIACFMFFLGFLLSLELNTKSNKNNKK